MFPPYSSSFPLFSQNTLLKSSSDIFSLSPSLPTLVTSSQLQPPIFVFPLMQSYTTGKICIKNCLVLKFLVYLGIFHKNRQVKNCLRHICTSLFIFLYIMAYPRILNTASCTIQLILHSQSFSPSPTLLGNRPVLQKPLMFPLQDKTLEFCPKMQS